MRQRESPKDNLGASLHQLRQEYVLIQAWKKTATYLRYHNWFTDTFEIDRATVNLPRFLGELSQRLRHPESWTNSALRIVPAPKTQAWGISGVGGLWGPDGRTKRGAKLRPLAHVDLNEQVAATALLLCLADRVETAQGDTRLDPSESTTRRRVVSYGNRLLCDSSGGDLHHRWGSSKLYRSYYQDYQSFVRRPEIVADGLRQSDKRIIILHSDLTQFYDRVSTKLLQSKIESLREVGDDPLFYDLSKALLKWNWHSQDLQESKRYAAQADLNNFDSISLPQGLAASGFLSNIVLLDFDQDLRLSIGREIAPGIILEDACRYCDDLRFVLSIDRKDSISDWEADSSTWIQSRLDENASGLLISKEKTRAATVMGEDRPILRQSRKMTRIQKDISGGFDLATGEEILGAIQGLIRSQKRTLASDSLSDVWTLSPMPDVRDATVSRFAAHRFRTTYRSLRPLLSDYPDETAEPNDEADVDPLSIPRLTRRELDDDAKSFALGLVETWVVDPSNVRLLRIALDICPSADILKQVLTLIRPYVRVNGPRSVAENGLANFLHLLRSFGKSRRIYSRRPPLRRQESR